MPDDSLARVVAIITASTATHSWRRPSFAARSPTRGPRSPVPPFDAHRTRHYLGLIASAVLVLVDFTIVVKKVAKPYLDPDALSGPRSTPRP